MSYNASALSAALKTVLETKIAAMQAAISAHESDTMLQDFCDAIAGAVVAHLQAHPVVIPIGAVIITATGGVPNPAPISTLVS